MAKILLVEDDNNLREIYEARLQAEGYDIVTAPDGEAALVVAKKELPDLVISDVMMPRISGFEMLDIMRNTEGLKHVKVIMLTALGQAEDKTRADSLGADKYLVKSQVTLEDIVNCATELLGGAAPAPSTPSTAAAAAELAAIPVTTTPAPATPVAAPPTLPLAVPPTPTVPVTPVAPPTPAMPFATPPTTSVPLAAVPAPAVVPAAPPVPDLALPPQDPQPAAIPAPSPAPAPMPVPTPVPPTPLPPAPPTAFVMPEPTATTPPMPTTAPPLTVPTPEPAAAPQTAGIPSPDDQLVADAVKNLIDGTPSTPQPVASTAPHVVEPLSAPAVPEPTAPIAPIAPSVPPIPPAPPAMPAAPPIPADKPKTEDEDTRTKKVIQPLAPGSAPVQSNLSELMAKEGHAMDAAQPQEGTLPHQPGIVISPNPVSPTGQLEDPNKISL